MYCINCGKEIESNREYCDNCKTVIGNNKRDMNKSKGEKLVTSGKSLLYFYFIVLFAWMFIGPSCMFQESSETGIEFLAIPLCAVIFYPLLLAAIIMISLGKKMQKK